MVSGSSSGASSALASRVSRSASPASAWTRASSAFSIACGEPVGLAAGGAGLGAVLAELLGDRGERGVGLVQLGEGDVGALLRLEPLALEPGHVEAEPLRGRDGLGELLGGLVDRGLDLDQARLARGATGGEVGAEDVAVAGDRGEVGQGGDQRRAASRSSTTATLVSSRVRAERSVSGHSMTSTAYVAPAGSSGQSRIESGSPAEQQAGAAEVVVLEVADGEDGGVGVDHGHRVGGRAEGVGDGGLESGADREQGGDRAEQPGDRVGGGEQGAGAVLAVEAHLEGVLAGGEGAAVAVGLQGLVAGLGESLLDVVEGADGGLVLGVETLLAGVETGDLGLERGEVALGAVGAGDGLLAGQPEPADLLVGGGGAGLAAR